MPASKPVRTPAVNLREKEASRLYREMVAAVRAWVRVACPDDFADRLVLNREDGDRIRAIAHFHSTERNPWVRGDLMAMDHRI
ncbi:MAG TPA: hypothetical protein VD866_17905 [Urbifossiella sp.]|nr:hypothetical protein [Urbifossiella sp.]